LRISLGLMQCVQAHPGWSVHLLIPFSSLRSVCIVRTLTSHGHDALPTS
jgi:hypothetical protein